MFVGGSELDGTLVPVGGSEFDGGECVSEVVGTSEVGSLV